MLQQLSFYKILNTGLRILPLAVKFFFIAALSKYLSVESYGDYLLITTSVTISIFVLGLDFYNFSIRNILTDKQESVNKIFNAFVLYFIVYVFFLIVGFIFFPKIPFLKNNGIFLISFICITEHLGQEIYRLQIAFKKILAANIIFFIRVFSWTSFMLIRLLFFEVTISINEILSLWLSFNIIALIISVLVTFPEIRKMNTIPKINKSFLVKGLNVSLLFLIGTISLKSIEYMNRYIVDIILGSEKTGVFSFYSNFIMIITVYINAIVISFELPTIIEKAQDTDLMLYFKKFEKSLLTQIILMSVVILIVIKPILWWQGVSIYDEYLYLLFFLLLGVGLINYSLAYHFYLYVKEEDKQILKLTVKGGLVNLILTIPMTYFFDLLGTSIAFTMTGAYMLYIRAINAKRINYG